MCSYILQYPISIAQIKFNNSIYKGKLYKKKTKIKIIIKNII